eukprot:3747118-Rhodomonas_salina.1
MLLPGACGGAVALLLIGAGAVWYYYPYLLHRCYEKSGTNPGQNGTRFVKKQNQNKADMAQVVLGLVASYGVSGTDVDMREYGTAAQSAVQRGTVVRMVGELPAPGTADPTTSTAAYPLPPRYTMSGTDLAVRLCAHSTTARPVLTSGTTIRNAPVLILTLDPRP